jgi:hypothetical protein
MKISNFSGKKKNRPRIFSAESYGLGRFGLARGRQALASTVAAPPTTFFSPRSLSFGKFYRSSEPINEKKARTGS